MRQGYNVDRVRLWLFTLLLFLGTVFIFRFQSTIKIYLVAVGLAYILMPAVNRMERILMNRGEDESGRAQLQLKKSTRSVAVVIVMFFVLVGLAVLSGIILPYVTNQLSSLIEEFPVLQAGAENWLNILTDWLVKMNIPAEITAPLQNFVSDANTYLMNAAVSFLGWLAQVSSGILNLVIVIILLIYFLVDGPRMLVMCRNYMLAHRLNRIVGILQTGSLMIRTYLKTQAMISGGMVIIAFIGMECFSIPYSGLFAMLLFAVDFVPYIGPIIGTTVIVIFTLIVLDLKAAIGVGIFLLILQQVEGNVIAPRIQGKVVGVHAVFIMLSLMVCFELWGPIGMLLATMIAGVMKIVLRDALEFLLNPEISLGDFLASGYAIPLGVSDKPDEEEKEPVNYYTID